MEEPRNRQYNMEDPKTNRATGTMLAIALGVIVVVGLALYLGVFGLDVF